jgi:hypothetical protein
MGGDKVQEVYPRGPLKIFQVLPGYEVRFVVTFLFQDGRSNWSSPWAW